MRSGVLPSELELPLGVPILVYRESDTEGVRRVPRDVRDVPRHDNHLPDVRKWELSVQWWMHDLLPSRLLPAGL